MLNLPGLMARPPRVQYGALPWRIADGTLEVLLLTSRGTGRWVIPKGWPHHSMSAAQSAAQEAFEEAGIKGRVTRDAIGTYRYDKLRDGGAAVECVVYVHALHVTRQLDDWPEKGQRDMQWFARATAAEHVQEPELRDLIVSYAPSLPYA
ncbi:NUDIX hydrolase [Oricola sp.]|uniref:NUDIX hydrolase n=1 Tax=Oricola sp. TaxID=1979950 RepID=UPI0025DA07EF|nr:NUDIX hydrolase [Oricola sp.]MCI5073775.1 NUDIX hydrolase [Oricola sp.]